MARNVQGGDHGDHRTAMEPIGGTPQQLGELARTDSAKYARLVKELNIKIAQ